MTAKKGAFEFVLGGMQKSDILIDWHRSFLFITLSGTVCLLSLGGCQQDNPPPKAESPKILVPSPTPILPNPSPEDKKAAAKRRQEGLAYRQQGRFPDAIQALKESVALDPTNLSGIVLLGWTLHLAQQPQLAKETLQQALKVDSKHVPALNALGIVYLVGDSLEQAVATHTQALALKPDNEIAHYNLSLAYHRLRKYPLALVHGKEATTLEPNNPHPLVAQAIIYWDSGEINQAKQVYRQAAALDSRYRQVSFLSHLKEAGFSSAQIQQTQKVLESTFKKN